MISGIWALKRIPIEVRKEILMATKKKAKRKAPKRKATKKKPKKKATKKKAKKKAKRR